MKRIILLFLFLCGIMNFPLAGSTFRVNNKLTDNAAAKIYSTLQKAHDAAYNGDTIMIEGTSSFYDSGFACSKKLFIKGPGYFLDENPGMSANKLSAKISGSITFNTGSAGSIIMGIVTSNGVSIHDDNIAIRRCLFKSHLQINSYENIVISECFFDYAIQINSGVATNLIFANNIFNGSIYLGANSTGVFLNNTFIYPYMSILTGFDMKNNIFSFASPAGVVLPTMPDPDICYNISIGSHFGTANNNKANVAEGSLFLGALSGSTDGPWQLSTGSQAIGAGEGGINCGAFGGPQPYILSGVPTGPGIYQLNVSSFSTNDNKLPVTIKVKSY
jgi:hypothetical protein